MSQRVDGWLSAVAEHAYLVLCLALLPMVVWRAATGTWLADFWEHAAVISELAQRPVSPLHPMLALDAPHALESPYHLALALVVSASGLSSMTVLGWAGVLNFGFFCIMFRAFVRLFSRRPLVPFLALLFTVFLWGPDPPEWSGFYHLRSFSNVMPYASTFATAAAFAVVWMARALLLSGRARWAVAIAVTAWLVLLSHPATFAFLVIGVVAISVGLGRRSHVGRVAVLMSMLVGAGLAAVAWPYYPIASLAGSDRLGYLRDNDPLFTFSAMLRVSLPALVGVPFLAIRAFRRWRDPLALIFVGATAAFLAARFGEIGSLATMIRFSILALHIAAADGIASVLHLRADAWRVRGAGLIVAVTAIVIVGFTATGPGRVAAGLADTGPDLSFLATEVPDDAVVLTDAITALEVPAWGPKVIAWHYAMPYVDDRDVRRAAIDAYFEAGTSEAERREILEAWCAEWILVVPERLDESARADVSELAMGGTPVAHGRALLVQAPAQDSCDGG